MANKARVLGAVFGFISTSHIPALHAQKDYMNWLFTVFWDLGFVALLFHQISCVAIVLRLRMPPYYNIARFTWAGISMFLIIIAEAVQGSNITAGYAWTHHLTRGMKVTLASVPAVRVFFGIYLILCITVVVAETLGFSYALLSRNRRNGPLSTIEKAQRNAFFGSLPFMGLYLVFACMRLWLGKEPTIIYFGAFQVAAEGIIAGTYILLTCAILRWDHWRKAEQVNIRTEMQRLWINALKDGIEYTRWLQAGGATATNQRNKPWIVALAELRFGIRAADKASPEKEGAENMLDTLGLLKQFAEVVTANLILQQRDLMPLLKREESRKPDVQETETAVAKVLLAKFKPISDAQAERLAHEWTPVFSMDPTELGPSMLVGRLNEARKSSALMTAVQVA
jgi:hypothetical protein